MYNWRLPVIFRKILCATVLVIGNKINIFVSWIPVTGCWIVITVPFPDKIVKTICLCESCICKFPDIFINSWTLLSPPEPWTCLTAAAFSFMKRSENKRNPRILKFCKFTCKKFQTKLIIFVLLWSLGTHLWSIKVCLVRFICSLFPGDRISYLVVCKIARYCNMPRSGRYTIVSVLIISTPFDNSLCCSVIWAIKRICLIEIIETSDSRINTCCLLYVLKFIFKIMRTILIYLLLTWNSMFTINGSKIIHKWLCFFCSLRVWKNGISFHSLICFSFYFKIVKLCPAPRLWNLNRIFALFEFYCSCSKWCVLACTFRNR